MTFDEIMEDDAMTFDDFLAELDVAIKQNGHGIYMKTDSAKMVKNTILSLLSAKLNCYENDVINRQDVLQAKQEFLNNNVVRESKARTAFERTYANGWNDCNKAWIDTIEQLPSAERKGNWIPGVNYSRDGFIIATRCSVCGKPHPESNFCPNCGADMRGEKGMKILTNKEYRRRMHNLRAKINEEYEDIDWKRSFGEQLYRVEEEVATVKQQVEYLKDRLDPPTIQRG